jgi:hypothetical protein
MYVVNKVFREAVYVVIVLEIGDDFKMSHLPVE